jgi:hypothetical protein
MMNKLVDGVNWLNKRLSLAIVMFLAGWIMAFQKIWLLRFEVDFKVRSAIAGGTWNQSLSLQSEDRRAGC